MVASATLVHLSGGHIELHFHYFVMVTVIALYQHWVPFLAALTFVVAQHGIMGVIDPHSVYNHNGGIEHPWRWAAVHGTFILAASAACVVNWRLNENARARTELLLQSAAEGIFGIDRTARVTFINDAAASILGERAPSMLRQQIHDIVHGSRHGGAAHEAHACWLHAAIDTADAQAQGEDMFWTSDGSGVPIEYSTMAIRDRGRLEGAVVTFRDITLRKKHEAQLARQANYDELTGLANRRLLVDQLQHALNRPAGRQHAVGVLFIDLDRFKVINDSLGHGSGDALLVEIAGRIDAAVRSEDTVARHGGDEFAVLLHRVRDADEAVALAEAVIRAIEDPMVLSGREIVTTASVGVAVRGPGTGHGTPDELLREADVAMYHAKAAGGAQAALFESSMSAIVAERLELENDLRLAVAHGELRLMYQPEVDLLSGEIVGMEALVRWQHPRLGLLPPSRFISVAEDTNSILELGAWVLDEACRQLSEWQETWTDGAHLVMAVNLSVRQLRQTDLVEQVELVLKKHGLTASSLKLEITESVMMQDPPATVAMLNGLKALGVRLAVDDFGTGYSSLSHLQRFPVDTLKIDRSFIVAMDHDEATRAIVGAVMALSKALRLEVTAEGIETEGHLASITALACTRGQGFYFSEPVTAAALSEAYRASRGGHRWFGPTAA
jgi:diguanylate cyclase (GGDEF)-like protein/PAS domain S-box-containing protein